MAASLAHVCQLLFPNSSLSDIGRSLILYHSPLDVFVERSQVPTLAYMSFYQTQLAFETVFSAQFMILLLERALPNMGVDWGLIDLISNNKESFSQWMASEKPFALLTVPHSTQPVLILIQKKKIPRVNSVTAAVEETLGIKLLFNGNSDLLSVLESLVDNFSNLHVETVNLTCPLPLKLFSSALKIGNDYYQWKTMMILLCLLDLELLNVEEAVADKPYKHLRSNIQVLCEKLCRLGNVYSLLFHLFTFLAISSADPEFPGIMYHYVLPLTLQQEHPMFYASPLEMEAQHIIRSELFQVLGAFWGEMVSPEWREVMLSQVPVQIEGVPVGQEPREVLDPVPVAHSLMESRMFLNMGTTEPEVQFIILETVARPDTGTLTLFKNSFLLPHSLNVEDQIMDYPFLLNEHPEDVRSSTTLLGKRTIGSALEQNLVMIVKDEYRNESTGEKLVVYQVNKNGVVKPLNTDGRDFVKVSYTDSDGVTINQAFYRSTGLHEQLDVEGLLKDVSKQERMHTSGLWFPVDGLGVEGLLAEDIINYPLYGTTTEQVNDFRKNIFHFRNTTWLRKVTRFRKFASKYCDFYSSAPEDKIRELQPYSCAPWFSNDQALNKNADVIRMGNETCVKIMFLLAPYNPFWCTEVGVKMVKDLNLIKTLDIPELLNGYEATPFQINSFTATFVSHNWYNHTKDNQVDNFLKKKRQEKNRLYDLRYGYMNVDYLSPETGKMDNLNILFCPYFDENPDNREPESAKCLAIRKAFKRLMETPPFQGEDIVPFSSKMGLVYPKVWYLGEDGPPTKVNPVVARR